MTFDERYHLHVGYYRENHDIEAVFFKVKEENVWCLFFESEFYNIELSNDKYSRSSEFGVLIGEYNCNEDEMTPEYGNSLFKYFLEEENIIQ
jgi:hypothetical protein